MYSFFKNARTAIVCVSALAVILAGLCAWRAVHKVSAAPATRPPALVSVVRAEPRTIVGELQAVGSLQAVREVLLAPDTSGRVVAINFMAGQVVKEGSILVQLYDAPEQAERSAAAAKAEFAQLQLQRSRKLAPSGAEPRELLEQRKAEAAQTTAAVRQLDARIQQKHIRAPFSGQLGIRRVNVGQYLNAGDVIATLTQLDPLYVNFTLPQQELPKLALGTQVLVTVDAVPDQVFEARVNAIDPHIDEETRNIAVQATLSNTGSVLKSGMYATVRLTLPTESNAIVLPLTAIQTSASGDSILLVKDIDAQGVGKAVATPVITGRRLGEEVLVAQGVEVDDIVIVAGQNRLQPGGRVRVNQDSSASAMAKTVGALADPTSAAKAQ